MYLCYVRSFSGNQKNDLGTVERSVAPICALTTMNSLKNTIDRYIQANKEYVTIQEEHALWKRNETLRTVFKLLIDKQSAIFGDEATVRVLSTLIADLTPNDMDHDKFASETAACMAKFKNLEDVLKHAREAITLGLDGSSVWLE